MLKPGDFKQLPQTWCFLKGFVLASTWVTDAWENKEFRGTLCILCGFSALLHGEVILPLPGDVIKRSVAASWCFSASFYLDVAIRRFSGGGFWVGGSVGKGLLEPRDKWTRSCHLSEK